MAQGLGNISGVVEELARRSSAIANFCVVGAGGQVPDHSHANPYLWLHVLGAYQEAGDGGERLVDGPAAMLFPAGSAHGMAVRERGLASVIVEFDADWLRWRFGPDVGSRGPRLWVGGDIGCSASRLARLWLSTRASDASRFAGTEAFLALALESAPPAPGPDWLDKVESVVAAHASPPRSIDLARRFGVSAPWLARAYRRWRGEGLAGALRRRRVETAALMLETEPAGLADVAIAAGFCDQSHMTRAFRRQIGRTPAALRAARLGLAGRPSPSAPRAVRAD